MSSLIENTSLDDWIAFRTDLFNQLFDDPRENVGTDSAINGKVRRHSFTGFKSSRNDATLAKANHANNVAKPRAKFLVGYNDVDQLLAITLVEESRKVSHQHSTSQACSIKITDLIELNSDLCLICSRVQLHFDPIEKIIWTLSEQASPFYYIKYLLRWTAPIESYEIEQSVQEYLSHIVDLCGLKLVKTLLFDKQVLDNCEDSLHQLQLKEFEQTVADCRTRLSEIVGKRKKASNLQTILTLYKCEDGVVNELREALDQWHLFQLVPFIQIREIALEQIEKTEQVLNDNDFGERVKHEHRTKLGKLFHDYSTSIEAYDRVYLDYYRDNCDIFTAQIHRAKNDERRFGAAFRLKGGSSRLEALQLQCLRQELALLNSRKSALMNRKALENNKQRLNFIDSDSSMITTDSVQEVNDSIQLLELEMEMLTKNEAILKIKLTKALEEAKIDQANQMAASTFFDTVETPEQLSELDRFIEHSGLEMKNKIHKLKRALVKSGQRKTRFRIKLDKQIELRRQQKEQEKQDLLQVNSSSKKKSVAMNISRSKSIDSLAARPRSSVARDAQKPKTMCQLRKETLNRLKKYEMNKIIESEGNEDDSGIKDVAQPSTPPLPWNDSKSSVVTPPSMPSLAPPPPPPPPPMSSYVPPPPPPPPPPMLNSPTSIPPPPPPLPPFSNPSARPAVNDQASKLVAPEAKGFSMHEMLQKRSNLKTNQQEIAKKPMGLDLREIVNFRNKLKPMQDRVLNDEPKNGGNLMQSLRTQLDLIKKAVEDSESDDDDDNDFDD